MITRVRDIYKGRCEDCEINVQCDEEDVFYKQEEHKYLETLLKKEGIGFCTCPKCNYTVLVKRKD